MRCVLPSVLTGGLADSSYVMLCSCLYAKAYLSLILYASIPSSLSATHSVRGARWAIMFPSLGPISGK